ncbi:MAG: penicillin-binding protein activator [Steroidobacteraceae bacterium]
MLHATLRGRQVRGLVIVATATIGLALGCARVADADSGAELARAEQLSREGQHAAAAAVYERQARRLLRDWETRTALLAAREYLEAGQPADAERVLNHVNGARGDDLVLEARVRAAIALARGDGEAALAALATVPRPWPAPLADELLLLEARADFLAGRPLDGIRAMEERGLLLGAADARAANDRLLLELLRSMPIQGGVPAGASDDERGWIELATFDLRAGDPAAARRIADWRARHPGHPGIALIPAGAGAAIPVSATAGPPRLVALLLPLSGRQLPAGAAVRDGYVAALLAEGRGAAGVRMYDTAAAGPVAAYQQAIADGAGFVVGPLTREDVAALVAGQTLPVPTLALNAWSGPGAPPAFLFQYALDPEQEARAAARRIAADGLTRGVALFPYGAWGDRLEGAFTAELASTGVALLATARYEPGSRDYSGPLRAALGRYGGAGDRGTSRRDAVAEAANGPQFAFLAATAPTARALVPQLRFQMTYSMPVYATSDAWDPAVRSVPDLDGLVYPEFPWVLEGGKGAPELWDVLAHDWAARARGRLRLFAFGHDAAALASAISGGRPGWAVDGLTGRLEIGAEGHVTRSLVWARIVDGRPQRVGAPVPPADGGR